MPEYGKSTNLSRTNIGSKVTNSAFSKAQTTAIGSSNSSRDKVSSSSTTRDSVVAKRKIHPGSRAGLNNHKSAYIQMNNSGYMNRSNQIARHKPKRAMPQPNISSINIKSSCKPKMFDGRLTSSPLSSISRLSKILGK